MNNNSNIYDIDGELIRHADDEHKWTVDEVKDKIEYYRKKLQDLAEDDKKAIVYATYMRNLSNYLFVLYSQMPAEQLNAEISAAKQQIEAEQVKKAMDELANEVNNDRETAADTANKIPDKSTPNNENTADEESGNDASIERRNSNVHEEGTVPEGGILEQGRPDTVMDEYVTFEEVMINA